MESDKEIEDLIDSRISDWKVPFDSHSEHMAKNAVMQRIASSSDNDIEASFSGEHRKTHTWLKVAAVVALIFAGGIAFFLSGNKNLKNNSNNIATINLPDGSSILYSPGSTVSYNSSSWHWNRTVKFSGEGYFEVNSGIPFTVNTPVGNVEVLGTAFTLWADHKDLFAHCTEGSVRVWDESGDETIGSGEFIDIEDGVMAAVMLYKADGFISPRRDKALHFESVPVAIVLNELEIALGLKIKNKLPSNLVYTGILDLSDENQCFQVFCKPFGAIFEKNADGHVSIYL